MGKALKTFIILNLVLSAVVITLGYQSFSERKLLKPEAVELEQSVARLSTQLKWGEDVAWETPEEKKTSAFTFSQPTSPAELDALKNELDNIARFSNQRQSQLNFRNNELVTTKKTLFDTEKTLATREKELSEARKQEADLTANLEQTNQELEQAKNQVTTLQNDKRGREILIRTKNNALTDLNNSLTSLDIDLETVIQERDLAKNEYDRCRLGATDGQTDSGSVRGGKGMVLAVNKEWQYVIIDKGDLIIEPNFQAFVHRGKDFVAKLKVVRVEDQLAIAEIIPGSAEGNSIVQPGDSLFF